jgi:monofunctional glycosyltransferase
MMALDETQPVTPVTAQAALGGPARTGFRLWVRRIGIAIAVLALWPIVMTLVYAVVPPPISNVMMGRWLAGADLNRKWVDLDAISPNLQKAVVSSEDARFCEHHGVDWIEFQGVIDDALDADEGPLRGASTISMQTAKNLFLWDGRSIIRKGLEIPLAYWMDLVWSKRRMIEVYLNIAEWGPGIYGAEEASQHHFKKPAAKLTRREAALLAAVLPNPIKRNAGKPSRGVTRIAERIQKRMAGIEPYLTCLSASPPL